MSDHYRALTRTYRPTSFDDIVSQTHVSDTLKNAIKQQRIAHAYMFCGPRGVGKTTMARVLARTVNDIDASVDGEGLNQTLNIVEIDAASNNSVDDIRDLRERVRIPPQNGRYKIYIIDEVHMLSKSAFNALLKTLEEPPDHVIFIFATTEPHKVLPTILSRVQRFDFKRISVEEIVRRLQNVADNEGIQIDLESLHVIAKKADGALRDALGLLDQAIAFCGTDIEHEELLRALNVVSTDRMFQFLNAVEANDPAAGLELIDELLQEGYDIQEFLTGLLEHLRNLYVALNSEKMHLVEASQETKKRYREATGSFSQEDLMRMMHLVSEAQYKIKDANQPRIQFEITLLKLIHMERTKNLNKLINELDALKKNFSNVDYASSTMHEEADRPKSDSGSDAGTGSEPNPDPEPDTDSDTPVSAGEQREEPAEPQEEENSGPSVDDEHPEPIEQPSGSGSGNGFDATEPLRGAGEEWLSETETDSETEPATPSESGTVQEPSVGGVPSARSPETAVAEAETDTGTESDPVDDSPLAQDDGTETDTDTEKEQGSDAFFGPPSLGTFSGKKKGRPDSSPNGSVQPKRDEGLPTAEKRNSITVEEVRKEWDRYLELLKQKVPQTLYFQMQRVEPVSVKNRELTLRCSNDFAQRIVEENKRDLAKLLDAVTGIFLQFRVVVQKTEEETEESKSPYERFKDLQERDPKIKMLVELFGAELDYNLSR